MTAAEKSAVKEVTDALRVHEEGHIRITQDLVKKQKLFSAPVIASSGKEAESKFEELVEAHVNKTLKKSFKKVSQEYDRVTRHGQSQSKGPEHGFPGGKDVVLRCP
jgi:spore coat polysaccharide biosynthesis protein SpsF (cytidylyltransferase family)